jgi:hypothetical protein
MGLYAYLSPIHNIFSGQSDSINTSMIEPTKYTVSKELLTSACESLPDIEFKFALNSPTGNFFYDKWATKDEFKNTVWDDILKTMPSNEIGEARIIKLDIKTCYAMHADIDDRWHLSFADDKNYLINLEDQKMYQTLPGIWYSMNAGILHSAANFSDRSRYQLVVRQLLIKNTLINPVRVKLNIKERPDNYRYILDKFLSPILNKWNKDKTLSNFVAYDSTLIGFDIEKDAIDTLNEIVHNTNINIEISYDTI